MNSLVQCSGVSVGCSLTPSSSPPSGLLLSREQVFYPFNYGPRKVIVYAGATDATGEVHIGPPLFEKDVRVPPSPPPVRVHTGHL